MRRYDIPLAILLGLGLWQAAVLLTDAPHYILPSPWRVAQAAYRARETLIENAWVTTVEVLLGLLIGTALGAVTAIHLALSKTAERLLLPLLVLLLLLPRLVLIVLLLVAAGPPAAGSPHAATAAHWPRVE